MRRWGRLGGFEVNVGVWLAPWHNAAKSAPLLSMLASFYYL
jgi:hypothetical protein